MEQLIHLDQTYCVSGTSTVDHVYIIQDVLDVSDSLVFFISSGEDFWLSWTRFHLKSDEEIWVQYGFIVRVRGSCVSTTPRIVWNLNIAIKTGNENT